MKEKFYKIKEDVTSEYLVNNEGFDYLPLEITLDEIVCKVVKLPYDSLIVKKVIEMYNSPKWQEEVLDKLKLEEEFKKVGIFFENILDEMSGKMKKLVVEDKNFIEMVTTWRLEVNFSDDCLLYFTTSDMSFPFSFYNKDILDTFCKNEIEDLKKKGIIEETDVIS